MPGGEGGSLLSSTEVWYQLDGDPEVESVTDAGYIVEGSQFEGQIRITNETIDIGPQLPEVTHTDENTGFLGENTDPTEQEYLANVAGNTSYGYGSTFPIFEDYPEGGTGGLTGTTPEKDPLVDFLNNYA